MNPDVTKSQSNVLGRADPTYVSGRQSKRYPQPTRENAKMIKIQPDFFFLFHFLNLYASYILGF